MSVAFVVVVLLDVLGKYVVERKKILFCKINGLKGAATDSKTVSAAHSVLADQGSPITAHQLPRLSRIEILSHIFLNKKTKFPLGIVMCSLQFCIEIQK